MIVEEALSWLNTPWHHAACVKGEEGGVDCAQLLAGVFRNLGGSIETPDQYGDDDEFERMIGSVEKYCRLVKDGQVTELDIKAGDVLVFRHRLMYNHSGIADGQGSFVHAYNSPTVGKVVLTLLDDSWMSRIDRVYRYKGVRQ